MVRKKSYKRGGLASVLMVVVLLATIAVGFGGLGSDIGTSDREAYASANPPQIAGTGDDQLPVFSLSIGCDGPFWARGTTGPKEGVS